MVKKNFNVTADIKHTLSNNMFEVVSGDTGNTVTITVTDGSDPIDLAGCRVIVLFRSNGGTAMQDSNEENSGISFDSEISNRVMVELFPASYSPGMVECELQIYSGEDMKLLITTTMFNFKCRASLLSEDTLNAAPEYPLLTRLIKQCSEIAAAEEERKQLAAKFEGMTVSASSLSPGSSPSADICEKDNVKHISFGIPEGRPGITPHIGDNGNWWLGQQDTGVSAVKDSHIPDWAQNDSAADDYIKNRTHWAEEPEIVILMPETTIAIDSETGEGILTEPINLVSGREYTVTWNNTEYTCQALATEIDGMSSVVLGNLVVLGADDTGEPFVIMELSPEGQAIIGIAGLLLSLDGSTNPTLSISSQSVTYHKLDNNYLDLDWLPLQKPAAKEPYTVILSEEEPGNYFYDKAFLYSLLSCDYIKVTLQSTDGEVEHTCPRIDTTDGVQFSCADFEIQAGGAFEISLPIEGYIFLKQPPSSPITVTIVPYVNTNKIPYGFLPKSPMIGLKVSEPVDSHSFVERGYLLMIKNKALILVDEYKNQYREIDFSPEKIEAEIPPYSWDNNSQSFEFSGINASNFVLVAPATGYENMWQECGMKYTLQENDRIQFTCETVPTESIMVRIMVLQW